MRLHINIDHVATLRNARQTPYPDPVEAARVCIDAGAHGITAHLREDRRHILDEDVRRLRELLSKTGGARVAGASGSGGATPLFNLEMAATDEMVAIARRTLPDVVTLVPERRQERTTEGGLDVRAGGAALAAHVRALLEVGIKVSLFIAADEPQIEASKRIGVQQIELHTGEYAHAFHDGAARSRELDRLARGAAFGHRLGLEVAAGHGLTRENVVELVRIPEIIELNIGHAVIGDAVFLSLAGAVRAMSDAIDRGRPRV
ncbi:pyridoxine 5'-phosphate synthase [Pendulispora albinea]|uniref:Pyridoxine 5'-phosphate synthase n=1 Tax=Pendulispora albinea TaxID=2741071 RepID=A0ABZ2LRN8_9BACT